MESILKALEKFFEKNRTGLFAIMFLVAVTGLVVGTRYYHYTKDDPEFCMTCHMLQESVKTWQLSKHWQIKCQECHKISVLEQNRLLIAYVSKGRTGPSAPAHARTAPWQACRKCHVEDIKQGSLSVRQSYGHAKHVFMENITCDKCHSSIGVRGQSHTFKPDERNCSNCHKDKLVHGMGMEGLSCLKCHSYGEEHLGVQTARCLGCHKDVKLTGPMAALKCYDCHKPHKQMSLTSNDCLRNCHGNEIQVGQHRLHMEKAKLECLDCHKPHGWRVGRAQARGLCDRCHQLKDPNRFIY
jgi:hypothetical protein